MATGCWQSAKASAAQACRTARRARGQAARAQHTRRAGDLPSHRARRRSYCLKGMNLLQLSRCCYVMPSMHGMVKSRAILADNELLHINREATSSAHGRTAGAASGVGAERSEQAAVAHALARLLPALAGLDLPCFLHLLGHRRALATVMRICSQQRFFVADCSSSMAVTEQCYWMSGCTCAHTGVLCIGSSMRCIQADEFPSILKKRDSEKSHHVHALAGWRQAARRMGVECSRASWRWWR